MNVLVLQSDASPCPIASGAAAVNVDVAPQVRILRRRFLGPQRSPDGLVLGFRNQAIAQTSLGVRSVRIAQSKRKIECALFILGEDVEVAFRSSSIAGFDFVADRTQAQADVISTNQFVA